MKGDAVANRMMSTNGHTARQAPEPRAAAPAPAGLPLRVVETDEAFLLTAAVPGVAPEDIEATWTADGLVLRGLRRAPSVGEGERALVDEHGYGPFERLVTFGAPIDSDALEARLEQGVLHLRLPKAPSARPRRIEIRPV